MSAPPTSHAGSSSMHPATAATSASHYPGSFYPGSAPIPMNPQRPEDLYRPAHPHAPAPSTSAPPMLHHPHHPHQHTHSLPHPHASHDDLRAHQHSQLASMPLHQPAMSQYHAQTDFDRMAFYTRPDAYQPYVPHPAAMLPSHQYGHSSGGMASHMGAPMHPIYGMPVRAATVPGSLDMGGYGSPKPSRKAKGHVASACVPCKKAHLRCDAHRPCTRCIMNGKEDCCIDVQHKKRGRPRLRDDRENRFDPRFSSTSSTATTATQQQQTPALQPTASPTSAPASTPDSLSGAPSSSSVTSMRHSAGPSSYQSHHSGDSSLQSRFPDRSSVSDSSGYGSTNTPVLTISTNSHPATGMSSAMTATPPEPVAYLHLADLAIVKASTPFHDALALPPSSPAYPMKLTDIVCMADREKIRALNLDLRREQERDHPGHLPPILTNNQLDSLALNFGFSSEDLSRFALDRRDRWTFQSPDGQLRTFDVRIGLVNQDSVFFVVLHLLLPSRFSSYSSPAVSLSASYNQVRYSPQGPPSSATTPSSVQQTPYIQSAPASSTFDLARPYGDAAFGAVRQLTNHVNPGQMGPGPSPGISPGLSTYAASPSRPEYTMGPAAFHTPRTDISTEPRNQQTLMSPAQNVPQMPMHVVQDQTSQSQQQGQQQQNQMGTSYHQLPPIRGQPSSMGQTDVVSMGQAIMDPLEGQWMKDDRNGGRVGIEGLIERPAHHLQQPPPSS